MRSWKLILKQYAATLHGDDKDDQFTLEVQPILGGDLHVWNGQDRLDQEIPNFNGKYFDLLKY